ncbi:unnamed protein product, partial [Pylaiella littoralis]
PVLGRKDRRLQGHQHWVHRQDQGRGARGQGLGGPPAPRLLQARVEEGYRPPRSAEEGLPGPRHHTREGSGPALRCRPGGSQGLLRATPQARSRLLATP